jgi:hypothetical protein
LACSMRAVASTSLAMAAAAPSDDDEDADEDGRSERDTGPDEAVALFVADAFIWPGRRNGAEAGADFDAAAGAVAAAAFFAPPALLMIAVDFDAAVAVAPDLPPFAADNEDDADDEVVDDVVGFVAGKARARAMRLSERRRAAADGWGADVQMQSRMGMQKYRDVETAFSHMLFWSFVKTNIDDTRLKTKKNVLCVLKMSQWLDTCAMLGYNYWVIADHRRAWMTRRAAGAVRPPRRSRWNAASSSSTGASLLAAAEVVCCPVDLGGGYGCAWTARMKTECVDWMLGTENTRVIRSRSTLKGIA